MNSEILSQRPDIKLSVKQTFGFDSEMKIAAFCENQNPEKCWSKSNKDSAEFWQI